MGSRDYDRIERAIRFLDRHASSQPSLAKVAAHVGLSPFHLQRLFVTWAGISPKRLLQCITVEAAKARLAASRSVLDAALDTGVSGPSRLHDLFVSVEAVTPGEYKHRGRGLEIRHAVADTPFGACLAGITPRGICHLSFLQAPSSRDELARLQQDWAEARLIADEQSVLPVVRQVFATTRPDRFPILLSGTNFQVKVWTALLRLPAGTCASYGDVARWVGHPHASRAVGAALAQNRIGYLIPCHRVLRETGALGGYRWGVPRKRAMFIYEAGIGGEVASALEAR